MRARERAIKAVPFAVLLCLVFSFATQVFVARQRLGPEINTVALPAPPQIGALRVVALGEPGLLARLMMLWLQAFDYQPGISLSFQDLDYAHLEQWLERAVALDPELSYPLLAAARLYGEVSDPQRQRRMLAFVGRHFERDPVRHWQWMAHAVFVAKHRIKDSRLALELAQRLARLGGHADIPSWVSQMHIFVLEDVGELESAKVLLGGLLESGEITDSHEQWFLSERLAEIEARVAAQAAAREKGGD